MSATQAAEILVGHHCAVDCFCVCPQVPKAFSFKDATEQSFRIVAGLGRPTGPNFAASCFIAPINQLKDLLNIVLAVFKYSIGCPEVIIDTTDYRSKISDYFSEISY